MNTAIQKLTALSGFILMAISVNTAQAGNITPSHVYQKTESVIAEIKLIRSAKNITEKAEEPGLQFNKKPLHVLTKSIELQEKISTAQKKNGISQMPLSKIPLRKITPADVLQSTDKALKGLRELKKKMGITKSISEIALVDGKSPSHVYENMWRASFMMDAISGNISPSNVFRNTQVILADLKIIGEKINLAEISKKPEFTDKMTPKDVNVEGYKNLRRLYKLQRKLAMKPVRVPDFPTGKITPSHVYDTTNMILGELARIKVKLGINIQSPVIVIEANKTPSDVHQEMRIIGMQLEGFIKNVKKS